MKTNTLASLGGLALLSLPLASCVVEPAYGPPPPPRHVYAPAPITVLPYGARPYYHHGEHCWAHNGHYYRRNPHGHGYISFRL